MAVDDLASHDKGIFVSDRDTLYIIARYKLVRTRLYQLKYRNMESPQGSLLVEEGNRLVCCHDS